MSQISNQPSYFSSFRPCCFQVPFIKICKTSLRLYFQSCQYVFYRTECFLRDFWFMPNLIQHTFNMDLALQTCHCTCPAHSETFYSVVKTIHSSWISWQEQKAGTVSGIIKKQLEKHVATNKDNLQQVSNMIGYKKSTSERQSLSEVKIGRGLAICKEDFRIMFLNIKLQTLNVPSSTVHNIIKRFRKSGDTSVYKGHRCENQLYACDLQVRKQHCIKNKYDSVLEITAWAQEHFQKSVCEHSSPCHPQMQVKTLSCKEEATFNYDPEMPCLFLSTLQSHMEVSDSNFVTAKPQPVQLIATLQWKLALVTFIHYAVIETKQIHFLLVR